jgi:hypothetical protein
VPKFSTAFWLAAQAFGTAKSSSRCECEQRSHLLSVETVKIVQGLPAAFEPT